MGNLEEIKEWSDTLENVYFGFTAEILKNTDAQKAAPCLSPDRLLLESDTPYLPVYPEVVNTPWYILAFLAISKLCR